MKKMGDLYTVKGKGLMNTIEKIQLFDGRFDTAYRLVKVEIANTDPFAGEEISIKIKLEKGTAGSAWNWGLNTQIGWAQANTPTNSRFGYKAYVDPDNLIVEDVFIDFGSATAGAEINYMLTFQKYDISSWQGALAMVRNKAQGGD
jgi:hypothetical protein